MREDLEVVRRIGGVTAPCPLQSAYIGSTRSIGSLPSPLTRGLNRGFLFLQREECRIATLDRELEADGLGVQLQQEGDRVVVRAWGELDIASAKEFEARLREAIRESSFGVILDLGAVTFIDSTGLRVLISAATLAHASRREFIVLRESAQVLQVIETSGVEDLLPLAD
jgi:anti-sigma B factor antagonist